MKMKSSMNQNTRYLIIIMSVSVAIVVVLFGGVMLLRNIFVPSYEDISSVPSVSVIESTLPKKEDINAIDPTYSDEGSGDAEFDSSTQSPADEEDTPEDSI